MSDTMLGLFTRIIPPNPHSNSIYAHYTDKKTGTEKQNIVAQDHTAREWQD